MKNKIQLILGVSLIILSLILIFVGLKVKVIISIAALIGLFIGIGVLMHWSTVSYEWVCDECREKFEISLKQNVLGINAGVNYKELHCPKCNKKTMCKGVLKE